MSAQHVVLLTRVLPQHSLGGMQAVAWDLAREFVRQGARVTVLSTRIVGRASRFCEEGVDVIALERCAPERYSQAWWRLSRRYFAQHLMPSATAVLSVSAAAYGLLALRRQPGRPPLVIQQHGTSLGEVLSKWRTGRPVAMLSAARNLLNVPRDLRKLRRFDALVAVGEVVLADLRRPPFGWALAPHKLHLIVNGIDDTLFCPDPGQRDRVRQRLGWSAAERVVVSASRLHAQKGVDHALRGFAGYARQAPLARFLIVGGGPERAALERLAQQLGVAERVTFAGEIARDELPTYLQAADRFLFTTTRVEGLPLNVLEALACGLPALVSEHLLPGLQDVGAIAGVDPTAPESIAAALATTDWAARSEVSLLPARFTLARAARSYLQLFEQLRG